MSRAEGRPARLPHARPGLALRLAPEPPRPPTEELQAHGAEEQLALCAPDHLRRLEQPLKYGFADRSSARKGLEVAAGVAIADRLGSIRQTAGPPIGRHGYMAIVWLGSRWLQLEQPRRGGGALHPVPPAARLRLGGVGQERPPGPQAHACSTCRRHAGRARSTTACTGRKTHEDHFGIIDRVLWPVVADGRVERLGYIFLGSWFLEQLRHEAGVYIDWEHPARPARRSPASSTACWRTTASSAGEDGEEWQAYWLGPPLFASVGSTCARERDNVAAVIRACEAIAGHPTAAYRFTRERVACEGGFVQQLAVWRRPRPQGRVGPRALTARRG